MASRITRSVPVSISDVLDGHMRLDLDCLDRLYLHGYLARLQVGGQVIQFLGHRGYRVPSPACLQQIGDAFRRRVASFAEANHIPVVPLRAADRNIEVMKPHLDRAAAAGRSQVAAIGVAQEPQRVFISRKRATDPGKCPQFSFDKKDRRVTVYYFYLWDAGFGPAFIKVCTYCPWPVKVWVNGHEWAKQQARKLGLGFTELSNGFAGCDDPALLQRVCDSLQPGTIEVFFQRWLHRLPMPLGPADRDAGWWWELSMAQVEVSRTIVFTQPRYARGFFDALVTDNLDLGRPDTMEIVFDRQVRHGPQRSTGGEFKTKVVTRGTEVTVNAFYKHSRIKQYLKGGRALRIETVVNAPGDLGCQRRLHNLGELQARARAVNARLLQTERAGQACVLANPVFERIAHPTVDAEGRRATAMRFGDSRVQALAGALCVTLCAVTGITNRSLRALMTGLLGAPYSMTQASYDLARLRRNQLITRRPHTNTYHLTADGLAFAIFYTKVHDRVLSPLFSVGQPQAPPALNAALRSIEQLIDDRLASSRLPAAA
ncbi:MAG TPA: hypothetical protein VFV41_22365 [Streptosporangiaceae bacterium]|nr:hypothetical protein [Streptosporangiaceae bacterium]